MNSLFYAEIRLQAAMHEILCQRSCEFSVSADSREKSFLSRARDFKRDWITCTRLRISERENFLLLSCSLLRGSLAGSLESSRLRELNSSFRLPHEEINIFSAIRVSFERDAVRIKAIGHVLRNNCFLFVIYWLWLLDINDRRLAVAITINHGWLLIVAPNSFNFQGLTRGLMCA